MTDQPQNSGDTTQPADDKGPHIHPDGMNPHIVPEKADDEEQTADDEA
jgi:hypothetical protein